MDNPQPTQMKKTLPALLSALLLCASTTHAIDNPNFSEGKKGWTGQGTPGYLDASGKFSATPGPDAVPVLRFELNRNSPRVLAQRVSAKSDENDVTLRIQALASADFQRREDSKDFDSVGFPEGGEYAWSASVYPKCDLLVRVKDSTWHYRPLSLRPTGKWKTFQISIPNLESRQREVEILFPPGEGAVYLRTGES